QDIKTADFTITGTLQAAVDWFNGYGEEYVTATRAPTATKVPAPLAFTFLSGGSDGNLTNTEWASAFTAAQDADVQWVVPLSSSAS
ncbi:hypothetical protein ACI3PL_25460, partial [Lacticaseibacillus paracasei]